MPYKDKNKAREHYKAYRKLHPQNYVRKTTRPYSSTGIYANKGKGILTAREAIFLKYGNKCFRCGFSDKRALQIDHVNGDGYKEKKELKGNTVMFYKRVLEDTFGRYQLLCANCNWIKRHENNEIYRREVEVR